MQQELGSAPAPGAVRRASRRTFAGRNHPAPKGLSPPLPDWRTRRPPGHARARVLPIFNCIVPAWAASFAFQPLFSAFQCFSVSAFDLLFSAFSISVFALTPGNKGSNHAPAEPGVLGPSQSGIKKVKKKRLKVLTSGWWVCYKTRQWTGRRPENGTKKSKKSDESG
jgi:hypothetical protein